MLTINNTIGRTDANDSNDIRDLETLLSRTGHLNLNKTDGPTGYFGTRLEQAIKSYQKDNDLKVDGRLNPGGETVVQLAKSGEISKPTKPVPPTAPSVQKPQKPIPPVVPGTSNSRGAPGVQQSKPRPNNKDRLKREIEEFWRGMIRKSL